LTDRYKVERVSGEKYLILQEGTYLPMVGEVFVNVVKPEIITYNEALMLKSSVTHTDSFGVERLAGSQWLVTNNLCNEYLIDVHQTKVKNVKRSILPSNQYCMIKDYVDLNGVQQWGALELRMGPKDFFV